MLNNWVRKYRDRQSGAFQKGADIHPLEVQLKAQIKETERLRKEAAEREKARREIAERERNAELERKRAERERIRAAEKQARKVSS